MIITRNTMTYKSKLYLFGSLLGFTATLAMLLYSATTTNSEALALLLFTPFLAIFGYQTLKAILKVEHLTPALLAERVFVRVKK